jgi:hypothetical protein
MPATVSAGHSPGQQMHLTLGLTDHAMQAKTPAAHQSSNAELSILRQWCVTVSADHDLVPVAHRAPPEVLGGLCDPLPPVPPASAALLLTHSIQAVVVAGVRDHGVEPLAVACGRVRGCWAQPLPTHDCRSGRREGPCPVPVARAGAEPVCPPTHQLKSSGRTINTGAC